MKTCHTKVTQLLKSKSKVTYSRVSKLHRFKDDRGLNRLFKEQLKLLSVNYKSCPLIQIVPLLSAIKKMTRRSYQLNTIHSFFLKSLAPLFLQEKLPIFNSSFFFMLIENETGVLLLWYHWWKSPAWVTSFLPISFTSCVTSFWKVFLPIVFPASLWQKISLASFTLAFAKVEAVKIKLLR